MRMRIRTRAARFHGGSRLGARLWFGVALLFLGLVWTLDNLRFLDADQVLDWWPVLLVAVGVVKLAGLGGRSQPVAGTFWLGIGALLLAYNLGYLPWGVHDLWPVGLVFLGTVLVWRSLRGPQAGRRRERRHGGFVAEFGVRAPETKDAAPEPDSPADTSTFSGFAVWSGVGRKPMSQAFRGGDFTAIMGGGEIDLRGAKPVPGGCVIEVFLVMGGVDIIVPETWTVVNELFAMMGGIEDSRKTVPPDGSDVLILKGFAFMGGVEIRN